MNMGGMDDSNSIPPPRPLDLAASREERRATGRMVALVLALVMIMLVMYHWVRKTPVLGSIMLSALILFLYVAGMMYSAKRSKLTRLKEQQAAMEEAASESKEMNSSTTQINNYTTCAQIVGPQCTRKQSACPRQNAINTLRETQQKDRKGMIAMFPPTHRPIKQNNLKLQPIVNDRLTVKASLIRSNSTND